METPNFFIWAVVVLGALGWGIGSMVFAYLKPVEQAPFTEGAIQQPSIALSNTALTTFVGAVGTYTAGDYRKAIDQLIEVLESEPNCAEAFHNLGRAYANIGDNDKALRSFLKASDAYDQQGTKTGLDQIKQDLETLKELS